MIATTTTDAAGDYAFNNLIPGTYTVHQPQPQPSNTVNGKTLPGSVANGGTAGTPTTPATTPSQIASIVLPGNTQTPANNFAEIPADRSISGSVFVDYDGSGTLNGLDHGIGGQAITLTGTDINGNPVTQTATTAPDGTYSFTGLPEGTYTVIQPNLPPGRSNGMPQAGNTGGAATNPTPTSSQIASINLTGANMLSVNNNFPEGAGNTPDLSIAKTAASLEFAAGSAVPGVFTLTPSNLGAASTAGVITITDTLPAGMTLAEPATGTGWTCPAPAGATALSCTSSTVIAANATGAAITVKVFVAAGTTGTLTNTAAISGGGEPNDFVGPENQAQASITAVVGARLSGNVWRDFNHDRKLDAGEPSVPNVRVELLRGGAVLTTTVTDSNGHYQFGALPPGSGYEIRFVDAVTGVPYFGAVTNEHDAPITNGTRNANNPAGATVQGGNLTGLTLLDGDNIVEQSLPLDPSGVVYDAVTRAPITGAQVAISGPPGFNPAIHLSGGAASQTQTTDALGQYAFWLMPGAPVGTYTLAVTTVPAGYLATPSTMIPACSNAPLDVTAGANNPEVIQASNTPPGTGVPAHNPATCVGGTGPNTTQYYMSFQINVATSNHIVNNNIPLDPILGGAIYVTKTTPKVNVSKGELVPYTITARNTLAAALANVDVQDMIPPGFRYRLGSATYNGAPLEPSVTNRLLNWSGLTFAPGETKTFQLLLVVGAGVSEGEYVNNAWAMNSVAAAQISNTASAVVRVVPDALFDCSDLIGKVFNDKNANGYQDQDEPGIPNVRIATARGLLVTTDADGRFHVACAAIPQADRGSNFVMKLDERTLPSGFRLTTENPRDVRVTRGKMVKLNFGATVHKVLRLEVDARAFEGDGNALTPQWDAQVAALLQTVSERPSVLRLAYRMGTQAEQDVAKRRLQALSERLRTAYAKQAKEKDKEDDVPRLVIETETFVQPQTQGSAQ